VIWENIGIALRAIRANTMRSILTTLGIIIGVAAVIAVVSVVQGLDHVVTEMFEDVGGTYITVIAYPDPNNPDMAGRETTLTYEDGLAVMEQATTLSYFNPEFVRGSRASYRGKTRTFTLLGVGPYHQEVSSHWVERGRFFSQLDLDRRASVCLVGTEVIEELDLGTKAIGAEITLDGGSYTVIGVMEQQGQMLGQDQDRLVLIPITTAAQQYGRDAMKQLNLNFQATSAEETELAKEQITAVLRDRHDVPEGADPDFLVLLQQEILDSISEVLDTVTAVVAAVVGIALLVGGIGIMNIMLVSVTERTREIGIRKAVGARRSDILVQFLVEAVTLCLIGGVLGVAAGAALGILAARLIPNFPPAHVPLWAVAVAFAFTALVGVVFGTYPAARAASLDPIDALRYE